MTTKIKIIALATFAGSGVLLAQGVTPQPVIVSTPQLGAQGTSVGGIGTGQFSAQARVETSPEPDATQDKGESSVADKSGTVAESRPSAKAKSAPQWAMPVRARKWKKQMRDPQNAPGMRIHPITGATRCHQGLDLTTPLGRPVRAVEDGKAKAYPNNGGAGNTIRVDHGDGLVSHYFHLDRFHPYISAKRGKLVLKGDVIGYVGTTGFSTGPHLHLEVTRNDKARNPLHWLRPNVADGPACPKGKK